MSRSTWAFRARRSVAKIVRTAWTPSVVTAQGHTRSSRFENVHDEIRCTHEIPHENRKIGDACPDILMAGHSDHDLSEACQKAG